MAVWFVVRGGGEEGPVSAGQLKEMAVSGKLRHGDLVRREDMQAPREASTIKGLFAEVEATVARPTFNPKHKSNMPSNEAGAESAAPRGTGLSAKKLLVVLSGVAGATLLLCCGVIGVFFAKDKLSGQKQVVKGEGVQTVAETPKNDPPVEKEKTADNQLTVSKGGSSGSIAVEISPEVDDEIAIRDLKVSDNLLGLEFKLTLKREVNFANHNWHQTSYDKDGKTVCEGIVYTLHAIKVGETISASVVFICKQKEDRNTITRVVIHR